MSTHKDQSDVLESEDEDDRENQWRIDRESIPLSGFLTLTLIHATAWGNFWAQMGEIGTRSTIT